MGDRLFFEDLSVGQIMRSTRSTTMERDRIVEFAREFDPHPGHLGEESATASAFGELVASGWHTASTAMRLMVDAMPIEGGGMGGSVDVRWLQPVRPGDVLRVACEVLELRASASRPKWGLAKVRTSVLNARDETVATLTSVNFLPRRPE